MSGVHRFLSRRDKKHPFSSSATQSERRASSVAKHDAQDSLLQKPEYFGDVFTIQDGSSKKPDKETEKKIKNVSDRLRHYGIDSIGEANILYALRTRSVDGDVDGAYRLVQILQDTYEGVVRPYRPGTKLLGAENRQSVTCYLDALLFAMFARLDSFEALLYDNFQDAPRRRLAGLLRLWVNMLRSGKLITIDITKNIQEALAACGWADAANICQQDPSEAFTFITDKLELPLLTLKMDLYHTGKEDPQDDHKFVNERLLEVAILDQPVEGRTIVTLEECLEHYFNNRIEVKRHLENQRRNTLKSAISESWSSKGSMDKGSSSHIEVLEFDSPYTPLAESPVSEGMMLSLGNLPKGPVERIRPTAGRKRADSIFSQRAVKLDADSDSPIIEKVNSLTVDSKGRKLSTRTEVLMPAWQFFKLLPWYTDHLPESDAQVAAHFSRKRPVLGICLKRYAFTNSGQATRKGTYIDIPLEIAVPNFVSDDSMEEQGPLVGNFRLMLQAVVCHRGMSVHSGHYICLCRGAAANAQSTTSASNSRSLTDADETEDPWMRFDDLAKERVTYVDIQQALKDETPYLLFYQVQPIDDDGRSIHDLPSYAEATSRSQSEGNIFEKLETSNDPERTLPVSNGESPPVTTPSADVIDRPLHSTRTSLEVPENSRGTGRSSFETGRRPSTSIDEAVLSTAGSLRTTTTNSSPSTPVEEKQSAFLSVANKLAARRGSRTTRADNGARSRGTSVDPEGRVSRDGATPRFSLKDLNMSKLTQRMSRPNESTPPSSLAVDSEPAQEHPAEYEVPAYTEVDVQHSSSNESAQASSQDAAVSTGNSKETTTSSKALVTAGVLKGKEAQKGDHKRLRKHAEDRECSVM